MKSIAGLGLTGVVSDVTYDAAGRPLQKTNAAPNNAVTTWSYDQARGILDGIQTTIGATTVQDLGYTIDDAGLARQVTSPFPGEGWQYDYDDLYRLTLANNLTLPAESQTFDYDAGGRILYNSRVGTYTYPSGPSPSRPHAPLTAGPGAFTYDSNGNLLSGAGRAPVWNADNLITQVGTAQFIYDALGERVKKTNGSTTSLYPFGDDYEITNGVITKYISIAGLGVVAKKVTGGPTPGTFWLHTDRLGSIQAVSDATQNVVRQRTYRPYGETLAETGSHTESRGWIDQRNDGETGLTYLHARYYDPQIGVFVSPDPIGVAGGLNQYGYGFGDPVNWSDRSGLEVEGCKESTERKREEGRTVACAEYVTVTTTWAQEKLNAPTATEIDFTWRDSQRNHGGRARSSRDPKDRKGRCQPGDPNCKPTTCDPATDPNCKEEPPECKPGDPHCSPNRQPNWNPPPLDRWSTCVENNLRDGANFMLGLGVAGATFAIGNAPVLGGALTAGEYGGLVAGAHLGVLVGAPNPVAVAVSGATLGGGITGAAGIAAAFGAGYAIGTFAYCAF